MKKIMAMAVLAIAFIAAPAFAVEYDVVFEWQQAEADLPNLAGWDLHMIQNSGPDQVVNIPYVPGAVNPFNSTERFTIDGVPGETVTREFFVVSKSKNGNPAAPSNTVNATFEIPFDNVTPATNLQVTGTVRVVIE